MGYKDARYRVDTYTNQIVSIDVLIGGKESNVPLDPANTDYQNIMKLVEDGELTIAPAEEPNAG